MSIKIPNLHLKRVSLGFLLLLAAQSLIAAELVASLDRNQLSINETFNLTLSYNQKVDTNKLDYSALSKQFTILSVSPSRQFSHRSINGRVQESSKVIWTFTLAPKRVGQLQIPSMSLNTSRSQALLVKVTKASTGSSESVLEVKAFTDHKKVFVNQQLLLTFRLILHRQGRPAFSFNKGDLPIAPLLMGYNDYQRIDKGIRKRIFEITYALFPEAPGELRIPEQTITTILGSKRVYARTKAIRIPISRAPVNAKYPQSPWLPAKKVTLKERWSEAISSIRQGEPITRTLTLEAEGQQSLLLPALKLNTKEGLKFYPNQPQQKETKTLKGLRSTRIETTALIAERSGKLWLPAIEVPWWNTEKGIWELAKLDQRLIEVKPARIASEPPPVPVLTQEPAADTESSWIRSSLWFYLWALSVLLLLALWYWNTGWRSRFSLATRAGLGISRDSKAPRMSEKQAWKLLAEALHSDDDQRIKDSLIQWGDLFWEQQVQSIDDFMAQADSQTLFDRLGQLNKNLYGKEKKDLDGQRIISELKTIRERKKSPQQQSKLPELYPK